MQTVLLNQYQSLIGTTIKERKEYKKWHTLNTRTKYRKNFRTAGKDVSDISVTHYSSSLQPYITAITETDKAYHNNLSILESAKENAGLTRDIANIKLEEFKATPHKTCAEYAPTDFSSDCIEILQAY